MKKRNVLKTLQIRLSPMQIKIIDELVIRGTYLNRCHAIRRLITKQLKHQKFNLEEWL